MSGKYIDFVPVNAKKLVNKKPSTRVPATRNTLESRAASFSESVDGAIYREETTVLEEYTPELDSTHFSLKKTPQYGVVEDFRPKFVKTEVSKRPLSQKRENVSDIAKVKSERVKSEKLGLRKKSKPVEKPVENSATFKETKVSAAEMKIPKSPFINHTKVAKRPLSKNIYEKKIEPTKEENKGPITIISKPEKDAKVGLVVTIILTIILGAAAGTIAFLLLPK